MKKQLQTWALGSLLIALGCGGPENDPVIVEELAPRAATAAETFTIGVLVKDASPAKANFTGAVTLAKNQIKQALAQSGIGVELDMVVAPYTDGQQQAVAIDLINNKGALGLVTDDNQTTADVNRLNYEFVPRVAHKFPVTCYQCSSPRFNDFADTDPGYADFEDWLVRTFFNATFQPAALVRQVLRRSNGGDLDNDGHLKIVVYFDVDHFSETFAIQTALDSLHPGSHSVEQVFKLLPSSPQSRADEMAAIFDTAPDGRAPDAVFLMFREPNVVESLGDYTAFAVSPRPPALTTEEVRRNYLLPSLLAAGGAGLEGVSVLNVSSTPSGALFKTAFGALTGLQPEATTAFLYDAVLAQTIAIGWARSNGSTLPEVIRGNFFNISDPTGTLIRPRVADFKTAAQRIKRQRPINYDGGASPVDLVNDEIYPDLVRWKIQSGKFVELERYRCNPQNPTCPPIP
jgi:hypothetical protein